MSANVAVGSAAVSSPGALLTAFHCCSAAPRTVRADHRLDEAVLLADVLLHHHCGLDAEERIAIDAERGERRMNDDVPFAETLIDTNDVDQQPVARDRRQVRKRRPARNVGSLTALLIADATRLTEDVIDAAVPLAGGERGIRPTRPPGSSSTAMARDASIDRPRFDSYDVRNHSPRRPAPFAVYPADTTRRDSSATWIFCVIAER